MSHDELLRTVIQGGSFSLLAYLVLYVTRVAIPMIQREHKEMREDFQRILEKKDAQTDMRVERLALELRANTHELHENTEALHSICKYKGP